MTPEMLAAAERLKSWRNRTAGEQAAWFASQTSEDQRRNLQLVRECSYRGGVLPHHLQPEGCGGCGELSACFLGRGTKSGQVTLRDCLECVTEKKGEVDDRPHSFLG